MLYLCEDKRSVFMQPLISIITINFNNAIGLEKTIESVVNQSFVDFEYIIIDGASTDSSVEIIEKHSNSINYWVSEKDSGIYNAMNKGIKVAKGEYLLFLNSGDALNGNTALKDFTSDSNFKGDIVYGDYRFPTWDKIYPDIITPLFFYVSSLPHQSTFFRKSVFEKMGNYEEQYKIVADKAMYIKSFLSNQFEFSHVNFSLTQFDLTGISNDNKFEELCKLETHQVLRECFGIFHDDYMNHISLQNQLIEANRNTIKGIKKRISKKLKRIFGLNKKY